MVEHYFIFTYNNIYLSNEFDKKENVQNTAKPLVLCNEIKCKNKMHIPT